VGWFRGTTEGEAGRTEDLVSRERELALRYLGSDGAEIHWDFIRAAVASVADTAIFPLQDVLGLGSEARMNLPSRAEGNWRWRFLPDQLKPQMSGRLMEYSRTYGRLRQ
jgi:4-alpha-glucanotransferase